MNKVADRVFELVKPYAENLGIELVEVVYEKKHDGMNLTVFIDKDGGVSINDCEALHRAIDEPLDVLDPIECAYTLNVSSLGLDRPLKTQRDFARNLNKKISVKLYKPMYGKKKFEGLLVQFDEESFAIRDIAGKTTRFLLKETAHIEPIIEF
ncbi:MAG: ribosome maturation factor RimP [Corallococcus sp.]|nr:ribosome maturation factor RimP [Corallococcus sp.]